MTAAGDGAVEPEEEDALWDRLVEPRSLGPEARSADRRPQAPPPSPEPPPAVPDPAVVALAAEVAALTRAVADLREQVEELGRVVEERDVKVTLDPDHLATVLRRLLAGMTFESPVMVRDQRLQLRLRLRPSGPDGTPAETPRDYPTFP